MSSLYNEINRTLISTASLFKWIHLLTNSLELHLLYPKFNMESSATPNQYTSTNRCVFSNIKFLFLRLSFLLFMMLLTSSPSPSSTREMSMYVTMYEQLRWQNNERGIYFFVYMNNYTQLLIIRTCWKQKISDVIVKSLCQGQTDINLPTSTNSCVMQVIK